MKKMPGQATIMKKWLRGDNLINIQGMIMFFVCTALPLTVIYL